MLQILNLSKSFGNKELFSDTSLFLSSHSRVALIGANGAGKSTIVKIILGLEHPDSGTFSIQKGARIGHLAQEVPKLLNRSVLEEVMSLDGTRERILEEKAEIENKLALEGAQSNEATLERLGVLLGHLEHWDEYRLESRAKSILLGMGFKEADFNRNLAEFSGGWLMRVALARLLLQEPELLILDEPTNHLDLESLLWVESFLKAYRGAFLIISHDRVFLNRLVNEVWEIDQKKIISYSGNIDSFARQKEERLLVLRNQFQNQQDKIAELERFVERFRAKATKARQAQSRLKQLEKMDRIELSSDSKVVQFKFEACEPSGRDVIILKDLEFGYSGKALFKKVNLYIQKGSRVAIVGPNGTGKTTLLKLIAGEFQSESERQLQYGHGVKIGYYSQMQAEQLNLNSTVLEELWSLAPMKGQAQIRGVAGAFLFSGDSVEKKCAILSGGEKARVALAKLLLKPHNFLILDEPTNHLDVESKQVLQEALIEYDGTICLVSHDREFVEPLVDTIFEIVPGTEHSDVVARLESYEDYLVRIEREINSKVTEVASPVAFKKVQVQSSKTGLSPNKRQALSKERTETERLIAETEINEKKLAEKLSDPSIYTKKEEARELMAEQKKLNEQLGQLMLRWEEIEILLEEKE